MDAIETINKLKELIFGTEVAHVELAKVFGKLDDGTIISYDSLEVGQLVNSVDEAGVSTPLTEGDYTLEDGSTLSVDANGIITLYTQSTIEETEMEVAPETKDTTDTISEERISNIESTLQTLVEAITGLIEKNNLQLSMMEAKVSEAESKVIELSKQPIIESITKQSYKQVETQLSKADQRVANFLASQKK